MNLEVLVSTMHQEDYSLLNKINLRSSATIINQCNKNSTEKLTHNGKKILWINTTERGLSKSRNMAVLNSTGDICLIADDDLIYSDEYERRVTEAFNRYPNADIITFQIEGIEKRFKSYQPKSKKLNYLTSMKVSSVEIAFRKSSINSLNIKFNELLGSGAKYFFGEESVFLIDCLKNGREIQHVPIKIADLHMGNSSWFRGYNKEYFIAAGAKFTAMSDMFDLLLILQFAIRKNKIYKNEMKIIDAIRYMLEGRKGYKRDIDC